MTHKLCVKIKIPKKTCPVYHKNFLLKRLSVKTDTKFDNFKKIFGCNIFLDLGSTEMKKQRKSGHCTFWPKLVLKEIKLLL